jgi:hypothetical protein
MELELLRLEVQLPTLLILKLEFPVVKTGSLMLRRKKLVLSFDFLLTQIRLPSSRTLRFEICHFTRNVTTLHWLTSDTPTIVLVLQVASTYILLFNFQFC